MGGLAPKMVEPTRTWVAPAAIASSKSCDMPIERCSAPSSSPSAAAASLRQRRSVSKSAAEPPSAAEYFPMHMSPVRRSAGQLARMPISTLAQ